MRDYFLSVILTALFGGITTELLPENSGVKPHLKLLTGLCVLLVLVLPAKDAIASVAELAGRLDLGALIEGEEERGEYEDILDSALSRYSEEEIGRCLGALIGKRFDLREGDCRARVWLGDGGEVRKALILLSGSAVLTDPYAIEAYVNGLLDCPCDVAVE